MRGGAYHKITIIDRKDLRPDFTLLWLESEGLHYRSGQYITLVQFAGETELRRSYSFVSSPETGEPMCIGVKRVDNGLFSRQLVDKAMPGDTWLAAGTGGRFVLPGATSMQGSLVFFAAGAGITPIFSIIKTALQLYPDTRLALYYSNPSEQRTLFLEELRCLREQYSARFEIHFYFSDAVRLDEARLSREGVQEVAALQGNQINEALYYICGDRKSVV